MTTDTQKIVDPSNGRPSPCFKNHQKILGKSRSARRPLVISLPSPSLPRDGLRDGRCRCWFCWLCDNEIVGDDATSAGESAAGVVGSAGAVEIPSWVAFTLTFVGAPPSVPLIIRGQSFWFTSSATFASAVFETSTTGCCSPVPLRRVSSFSTAAMRKACCCATVLTMAAGKLPLISLCTMYVNAVRSDALSTLAESCRAFIFQPAIFTSPRITPSWGIALG